MSVPFSVRKNAYAIRLSAEQVYWERGFRDSRYNRLVERIDITQPTEQDWADYRKAREAYDYLLESAYFDIGCSCEHPSVSEPTPSREYVYAETHEEWLARCKELDKENE